MSKTKIVAGSIAAVVLFVVVMLGLYLAGVYGGGTVSRKTANFRGQTAAIEKTKANADFRITSYNKFFDLCNGVKSTEEKVTLGEQTVSLFKGTDQETTAIVNLQATKAERINLINEYNSLASRGFTEGQFRDSSLPYQIDPTQEITTCK